MGEYAEGPVATTDTDHPAPDRPLPEVTIFGREAPKWGRSLSTVDAIAGWALATILLVVSIGVWVAIGGLVGDNTETSTPVIAIAHGQFRCAYRPQAGSPEPPLYPLIAGGLTAVTHVGESGFPTTKGFDADCGYTSAKVNRWYALSSRTAMLFGFIGWPVLLAGSLLLLASAGRRRTRWESLGLCAIAILPPVAATLIEDFQPEDLFAMGLILASLAAAIRSRWITAGLLMGMACCSKQYALLAAIPLLLLAPGRRWWPCLAAAGAAVAILVGPLILVTHGGIVDAMLGGHATGHGSGTPIDRLHLSHAPLVVGSRILPLVIAVALGWWMRRRLRGAAASVPLLLAVVATSLSLRLVFEIALFSYYFMALAVMLVLLDFVLGRVRIATLGWLVLVTVFFPPSNVPYVYVHGWAFVLMQFALTFGGLVLAALPMVTLLRPPDRTAAEPAYA